MSSKLETITANAEIGIISPNMVAYLGVDVGSVSTNLVMISPSGEVLVSRIRLGEEVVCFGDVCERYTAGESRGDDVRLPNLFLEVEELLDSCVGGPATLGVAAIPRALMMICLFGARCFDIWDSEWYCHSPAVWRPTPGGWQPRPAFRSS
jgi:hypothetical protein